MMLRRTTIALSDVEARSKDRYESRLHKCIDRCGNRKKVEELSDGTD
ncbi:MAG: hypothetical protein JWM58_1532 [Rhizobium sp.]|nr:hypothetical protein [Rhizobium sp.]